MKMYRVRPRVDRLKILEAIKNKGSYPWPNKDFACRTSAEKYAFWVALQTGQQPEIELRDPDQYATLREKVAHIVGAEQ